MSNQARELILYSTPACHLCETAQAVIAPFLGSLNISLQEVDISDSDDLMEKYGIRIPVLRFSGYEQELGWPFSEEEFLAFAALDFVNPD